MNAQELFKSSESIKKSALSEFLCVFVMFSLGLTLLMFGKQKRTHPGYSSYLHRLRRWNSVFRNVGTQNSEAGESPKSKNTTFRTRRKFEIKKMGPLLTAVKAVDLAP
jgi:cbb3-type cytochrome oxidase subunit 3